MATATGSLQSYPDVVLTDVERRTLEFGEARMKRYATNYKLFGAGGGFFIAKAKGLSVPSTIVCTTVGYVFGQFFGSITGSALLIRDINELPNPQNVYRAIESARLRKRAEIGLPPLPPPKLPPRLERKLSQDRSPPLQDHGAEATSAGEARAHDGMNDVFGAGRDTQINGDGFGSAELTNSVWERIRRGEVSDQWRPATDDFGEQRKQENPFGRRYGIEEGDRQAERVRDSEPYMAEAQTPDHGRLRYNKYGDVIES